MPRRLSASFAVLLLVTPLTATLFTAGCGTKRSEVRQEERTEQRTEDRYERRRGENDDSGSSQLRTSESDVTPSA